jgi:methionyl-tRNA synthetase
MHRVVGRVTRDHKPLYPRLDDVAQNKIVHAVVPSESESESESEVRSPKSEVPAPALPTVSKDDFDRIELRVGKILDARAIPKKDRVLELRVDLGDAEPRTIVAGIAQQHKPESLVGKSCVFVANLAPRDMGKGLVSHGMILAAGDDAILTTVAGDVPPGTRVR